METPEVPNQITDNLASLEGLALCLANTFTRMKNTIINKAASYATFHSLQFENLNDPKFSDR